MDKKQFEQYKSIPKEKFAFATQGDTIHDKKLETKAVSYARDSIRRFCKNKASVVAAIILGILILLAIFVPVFSPYDLERVSTTEQFLTPKLFPAGTGFWDGTEKFTHVAYDVDKQLPVASTPIVPSAVMSLVVEEEPTLTNQASPYAKGGYVMFENQTADGNTVVTLYNYYDISATADGQYAVSIVFGDKADALGSKLGEYRITFVDDDDTLVLRDWTTDYTDATFNISSALSTAGLSSMQGKLTFELKSIAGSKTYILIESCVFSAAEGTTDAKLLESISFADASEMVLRAKNSQNEFPDGYWQCNGRKGVFESKVYYCDYVYDTYEAVYGKYEVVYAKSELDKLVAQGLCSYSYDYETDIFVFEKLSDDCPIEDVVAHKVNNVTLKVQEVTGIAMRYRKMGYSSMPKYIFGTDGSGVDVLTRIFYGLRTSLLLGVCTFAFCFTFGLVWGAISGYFGGWVDLSMERFMEILGGVPSLVVLTLCILHLGNNFSTFFLALCLTGWMGTASLTRTQFYRFKGMEHVLAARTLGASDWRLIFKHILPNSLGTIITSSAFMITSVIYTESTLAYLNLGLKGTHSFGVFLANNQQYLKTHPYLMIIPAVIMTLLMISFNLFANGLRDAVNPTLKGSE